MWEEGEEVSYGQHAHCRAHVLLCPIASSLTTKHISSPLNECPPTLNILFSAANASLVAIVMVGSRQAGGAPPPPPPPCDGEGDEGTHAGQA